MIIPQDIVAHGIHVAAMDEAYGSYAADDECFDNHDYDDTDDDNDHKNDSYTAAGAAPGARFLVLGSRPWFWLRAERIIL